MKLIQYLRVKLAQQKLDYNPDEAQALLEQADEQERHGTMAERIAATGRMLRNPELYFNSIPVKDEPTINENEDGTVLYSRGAIDAQNNARRKQLTSQLKEQEKVIEDAQRKNIGKAILASAMGAWTGLAADVNNEGAISPFTNGLSMGIGGVNGAFAARKLFGDKAMPYGAVVGGGLHTLANVLATRSPLLRTTMHFVNPALGGIAGYNISNSYGSELVKDEVQKYKNIEKQKAKEEAEMQAPLYPELFDR